MSTKLMTRTHIRFRHHKGSSFCPDSARGGDFSLIVGCVWTHSHIILSPVSSGVASYMVKYYEATFASIYFLGLYHCNVVGA